MATAWQLPAFHCLYNNLITFSTTYHYFLLQRTSIPFRYSDCIKAETCCRMRTWLFWTMPKKTLDNTYGRTFLASAVMTKSAASDVSHVDAADWLLRFSNIWSRTGHCFKGGVKSWWYPSAELFNVLWIQQTDTSSGKWQGDSGQKQNVHIQWCC